VAAFLASTLPIPGISMNTPAISYFSWVKCAYK